MDPFGNNRIEDVNWLCSLSESELDMLISLKKLVIQRAKVIGYPDLASKIDLKMLRALGFILMEYCKVQMIDKGLEESVAFLSNCKLLDTSLNGDADIRELMACVSVYSRKRKGREAILSGTLLNGLSYDAYRHPVDDEGDNADEKSQSD